MPNRSVEPLNSETPHFSLCHSHSPMHKITHAMEILTGRPLNYPRHSGPIHHLGDPDRFSLFSITISHGQSDQKPECGLQTCRVLVLWMYLRPCSCSGTITLCLLLLFPHHQSIIRSSIPSQLWPLSIAAASGRSYITTKESKATHLSPSHESSYLVLFHVLRLFCFDASSSPVDTSMTIKVRTVS